MTTTTPATNEQIAEIEADALANHDAPPSHTLALIARIRAERENTIRECAAVADSWRETAGNLMQIESASMAEDIHSAILALSHTMGVKGEECHCTKIEQDVKLDGPELWEIVFGIATEAAHEITDEQYSKIAEAINTVFIRSALTPTQQSAEPDADEAAIDALRYKAFMSNSEADRQAYFDAVSKWFQHRHYRRMAHPDSSSEAVRGAAEGSPLLEWAVSRWNAEVKNRPLINVHRRTLDDTWRQVIRWAGGDPDALVGMSHDDLLALKSINGEVKK